MEKKKRSTPKKHKPSQIELEYKKQRKRLQAIVQRERKKGYTFPANVIPAKPKKITKGSVSRLAKITPRYIRQRGTLGEPPKPKYKPPRISDNVLRNVEALLDRFPPPNDWKDWQYAIHEKHYNMIKRILDTQIMLHGRTVVAYRLEKSSADLAQIVERLIYGDSDEGSFQVDAVWFAQIVKGDTLSAEESLEIMALVDSYGE